MITMDDIANATFRKAKLGGYNPEDVNEFLDQVQASYAQMQKEKMELVRKLEILAKKVEEYREEEESIRNTLFSAQKLADASVREAKHKSEVILKDASAKADKIVNNAQVQIMGQQETLKTLQHEVSSFRSRLIAIYKEHLTLIDALPTEEKETHRKEEAPAPEAKQTEVQAAPPAAVLSEAAPAESVQQVPAQPAEASDEQPAEHAVVAVPFAPEPAASAPAGYAQPSMAATEEAEGSEKFSELQFGEHYSVRSDIEESPLGLFKHKK